MYGGLDFRVGKGEEGFFVSEDVKRRDFWGSILKACYEVVWGLGVGVERKILFYATFVFKRYYYIFDVSC